MRVAEHAAREQPHVLAQLRVGIEAAAGVVEIDVPVGVQAREFCAAQLVERRRRRVVRVIAEERGLGGLEP